MSSRLVLFSASLLAMACCGGTAARAAQWDVSISEDPMDDKRVGFAGLAGVGQSIAIKCWESEQPRIMVLVDAARGNTVGSETSFAVRVDKSEPIKLQSQVVELGGGYVHGSSTDIDTKVMDVFLKIMEAKTRVVVAADASVHEMKVSNSAQAMKRLAEACGISQKDRL